ncbi:MAG: polymer-forming cytoskeletal protein [Hyphomicrobiaceae bacterium]
MTTSRGRMVVAPDMAIKGTIHNCQSIEVQGYLEGEITAKSVVVTEGGRVFGRIKAEDAEIDGQLQGDAFIKNILRIGATGDVSGNVRYGQLTMELGARLSADVRNIPPSVFGDLEVTVGRGQTVRITLADLTAVDPDDAAANIVYTVVAATAGWVESAAAAGQPVSSFSQADLEAGYVSFRHDGSPGNTASFSVVVSDSAGGSSGDPKTVRVIVR